MVQQTRFYVPDLHCGGCVKRFNASLSAELPEIQPDQVHCDPLKRQVTFSVPSRFTPSKLRRILTQIGFPGYVLNDAKKMHQAERKSFLKRIFVAAIGSMQVMMFSTAIYLEQDMPVAWQQAFHWFSFFVTTPVLFYSGKPYFISAIQAVSQRQVNMEVPIALALTVAYLYSIGALLASFDVLYFDSINMFLLFLTLGRFAEWVARHQSQQANEALWSDLPQQVTLVEPDGDQQRSLDFVKPGHRVRVKPGQQCPVDGVVEEGESLVDESMLTGESKPVPRGIGDQVYAGTVNHTQSLIITATAVQGGTQLGHIQQILFEALDAKPKMQQLADQVAGIFIAALLVLALIVAVVWFWLDPSRLVPILVSVLIVTCPCALALATPAAIASALAALARQGILVSRGDALEKSRRISHILFDKTGTLTDNVFVIDQVQTFNTISQDRALALAQALEIASDHPLARPFHGVSPQRLEGQEITLDPGLGVTGRIDGETYYLGAPDRILPDFRFELSEDHTVILLARSQGQQMVPLALFGLKCSVRPDAAPLVQWLKSYDLTIVSGDHERAVAAMAQALGITRWFSRETPASKRARIQALQEQGHRVLMVGDGVNDGPVLAQADVGLAMGQGTALAKASADVILLHDRLLGIKSYFEVSARTLTVIRQNMCWAVGYNLIAVPFAAMGLVPPWLAAIGMSLSSLLVVLNSLRLAR